MLRICLLRFKEYQNITVDYCGYIHIVLLTTSNRDMRKGITVVTLYTVLLIY